MADSLIDTISQFIAPSLASRISAGHGESQPAVTKALSAVIPALLGMVTNRAKSPEFISQVYSLARNPENDSTVFDDPTRLLSHVTSPARDGGPIARFQSLLLGSQRSHFVETIADYAGVKTSTATSILAAAVPMVLGYLGKMIRHDNLDAGALAKRLSAESRSVSKAIPAAFSSLVDDTATTEVRAFSTARDEAGRALHAIPTDARLMWPWAATALALVALIGGLYYSGRYSMPQQTARVVVDQTERTADRAQRAIGTTGLIRKLPNGVELNIPARGSEATLLNYTARGAVLAPGAWVEFDRVDFKSDSASLTEDSREQLSGIASILKAYPAVDLKIGGYTDNTGDAAANLKLSQDRATSVMNQLVSMGVPSQRLQAEGYGSDHPIATNATDEGRAKNRRVSFRVTAR